jgi:uncharacterized protein (TIGR03067 family)
MRLRVLTVLAVGLLLAAEDAGNGRAARKELTKLEGTWAMVSGEQEGKKIPEDVVKTAKLVIKGDRHTVTVGDETFKGTHKVNPSKTPKQIDTMDTAGPFKDKTAYGIYEVDEDGLKVCFAPPGKERPKEFTTKSGTGVIFHVWKRHKE